MIRASVITLLLATITSPAIAQVADTIRIGAVNLGYVARTSKIGKSELAKIEDVARRKTTELEVKSVELQKQQSELQKSGVGLSPRAVADLQRAFDRSRLDFERLQQDARNEIEAMQTQFEIQLRARLEPVIDAISKEKGLYLVFGLEQTPMIVWWSPSVDISEDVVKRLDAAK